MELTQSVPELRRKPKSPDTLDVRAYAPQTPNPLHTHSVTGQSCLVLSLRHPISLAHPKTIKCS